MTTQAHVVGPQRFRCPVGEFDGVGPYVTGIVRVACTSKSFTATVGMSGPHSSALIHAVF